MIGKRFCIWLLAATIMVGLMPASILAQDTESTPSAGASTPSPGQDGLERAFEFFPAETGWGTTFDVTIEPGSSVDLTVLLANVGLITQDLRTYSVNAFTAEGGGLGVAELGIEPNRVTSWVDYPEEVFTIEPGTGVERTFKVTVPEDTPPGEYVTALVGAHAEAQQVEGSANFAQILRYATPIFITVPGKSATNYGINNIEISMEEEIVLVDFHLDNSGDMNVFLAGVVDILDGADQVVASIPVSIPPIYARDSTPLRFGAPLTIPGGTYRARVSLEDSRSGLQQEAVSKETALDPLATPVVPTVLILSATVDPEPDAANIQFATIEATISNSGDPITNGQLSLIASVNGEEVERYPVSQSLSLPNGDTPITTRYIPATGWTAGTWTFELLLENVEPGGGSVVVGRYPIQDSISIP